MKWCLSVCHAAYSVISGCSALKFVSVIAKTSGISKFVFINFMAGLQRQCCRPILSRVNLELSVASVQLCPKCHTLVGDNRCSM